MTGFNRVIGIGTEVTLDGQRHLLADVLLPERTGTVNAGLPPRPAAIRMTLAMRPAEGPATTLDIPADLAFVGETWCWLEDAMPLVAADSTLQPHALADLLRAGFFSSSDDAALHLATRLLLSDEDACRASIAEAVRRDLFWLVPRTRHNTEAIADRLPDCRGAHEPTVFDREVRATNAAELLGTSSRGCPAGAGGIRTDHRRPRQRPVQMHPGGQALQYRDWRQPATEATGPRRPQAAKRPAGRGPAPCADRKARGPAAGAGRPRPHRAALRP